MLIGIFDLSKTFFLKSGEIIIKSGSIIPSQIWIEEKQWTKEQERFKLENKAIREEWKKKQRFKQNEKAWQEEWVRLERCLAELEHRS